MTNCQRFNNKLDFQLNINHEVLPLKELSRFQGVSINAWTSSNYTVGMTRHLFTLTVQDILIIRMIKLTILLMVINQR